MGTDIHPNNVDNKLKEGLKADCPEKQPNVNPLDLHILRKKV